MIPARTIAASLGALASLLPAAPAVAARPSRSPSPVFSVSYTGSGSWHTTYHATPPNPGGNPDTNDAHDTSTQRWSLRFTQPLRMQTKRLAGATGLEAASGRIRHSHLDGLYPADNASESCTVSEQTPKGKPLAVVLEVRRGRHGSNLAFTAMSPMVDGLSLLPSACPQQGDSIDGLLDDYFTPGFSFAAPWGPDRWFTSQTLVVSSARLRRARRIDLHLHATRHGTPPGGCAVLHPEYERCRTGGSWTGTLRLRRRPGS